VREVFSPRRRRPFIALKRLGDEASHLSLASERSPVTAPFCTECWPLASAPTDVVARWLAFLATSDGPCPVLQAPGSLAVAVGIDNKIDVRVLAVRDFSGEIVGIQPVRYGPVRVKFGSKHRTLFSLGLTGATLLGSEPLVAQSCLKSEILKSILRYLKNEKVIEFNELNYADEVGREVAAFSNAQHKVFSGLYCGQWTYAPVPRSIDNYYAGLGKKKAYNLKRQHRLLAEHLSGDLELVVVRDGCHLPLLVEAIRELTGWTPAKLRWAEKDAELSCREGIACFFILKCGDHLIGLVRATAWGSELHVHSMHRNIALEKFSPGTALWQIALTWLITGGIYKRIVFAYGTPAQGNRANNVTENRSPVLVFRKSLSGSSIVALYAAFDTGKSLAKLVCAQFLNRVRNPDVRPV
jgi:hypothetical protein